MIVELLVAIISSGTPLLLATIGEIMAERSGIINLGLEGLMAVGAVIAFIVTLTTGNPLIGLLVAGIVGALLAFVHGFACITLRSNQIVSGLAISMLGLGLSALIGRKVIGIPLSHQIYPRPVPLLKDIPILGAFFRQNIVTYISYILVILFWFLIFKTKIGICIRACGENPRATDTSGINVTLVRYACTLTGGVLAALGGAYISTAYTPVWIEGMSAGAGWIAIALVIFVAWNPIYALLGAYFFGGIEVIKYKLQPLGISPPLLMTLPYICTIVALVFFSSEKLRIKFGAPAALGLPYSREEVQ